MQMLRRKFKKDKWTLEELEKCLNEKQKATCHEYISNGWDRTKAYTKFYNSSSQNVARVNSFQFFHNPKIVYYVNYIKEDYEKICKISKAKQIQEYAKIAYSSIAHLHDNWITLKDFESLSNAEKEAIETIETKTEHKVDEDKNLIEIRYVKIKLHNKIAALEKENTELLRRIEKLEKTK